MGNYTREEILQMAEEEDVEFNPSPVHRYVRNAEKHRHNCPGTSPVRWITDVL